MQGLFSLCSQDNYELIGRHTIAAGREDGFISPAYAIGVDTKYQ